MLDIEKLVTGLHDYIARALTPLHRRLEQLEAREPERGAPGKQGEPGRDGADGKDGRDGESVTLDQVREQIVEPIMARWELEFERRAGEVLQRSIEHMPAPKDGRDGRDGRDGFGFDDIEFETDGERRHAVVFRMGDAEKRFEFRTEAVIDRGVYKADGQYERGDGVTYLGSYWIAKAESPTAKPGEDHEQWRLAVKKGRDGRHGKDAGNK